MFISQQYEEFVSEAFATAMEDCEPNDDAMAAFLSL